jgi:hypothetical protein
MASVMIQKKKRSKKIEFRLGEKEGSQLVDMTKKTRGRRRRSR